MAKKIGTLINQMGSWREKEEAQRAIVKREQEKLDKIRARKQLVADEILNTLPGQQIDGAMGKAYTAEFNEKEKPTVVDWNKVYNFIYENDCFDLLCKKINESAWKELREELNIKRIPGIKPFKHKSITLRKR